jgi:predicted RNA-binding Zn-ribbon protein involved in translation (DUF1610 family)
MAGTRGASGASTEPGHGGKSFPVTNNPGHDLAALRRKTRHTCPVCGASFEAIRTAVYCSNRCRQAAKYQRKRTTR